MQGRGQKSGLGQQAIQRLGPWGGQPSVGYSLGAPTPPAESRRDWEGGRDVPWEEGCLSFEDL